MNGPGWNLLKSEPLPVEPRTVHPSSLDPPLPLSLDVKERGHGAPAPPDATSAPCRLNFSDLLLEPGAVRGCRYRAIAARQNIYRAGETADGVLMITDGWAVRFVQLPNGKRQILSLMMPGDLVSAAAILEQQFAFSVQAVTDARTCLFPFALVRRRIADDPSVFDAWIKLAAAELRDADRRLVDLGQRTAQERIAALILHVMLRAEERGELDDNVSSFPLSQQQIADFAGLTPVHTCRVLSALRKSGICRIAGGTVKILDRVELKRIGSLR